MSIGTIENGTVYTTPELAQRLGLGAEFASVNGETKPTSGIQLDEDGLGFNESMLRAQTGYRIDIVGHSGYEQRNRDEEEEKRQERNGVLRSASLAVNGVVMSYEDVVRNLGSSISLQEAALEAPMAQVKPQDLLYVNSQGKIVSPDDPDARVVDTLEEKAALENENEVCLAGMTTEDVTTTEGGLLVARDEFNQRQAIEANMRETQEAMQGLQNGTLAMEDLPQHIQEQIADIQNGETPDAFKPPVTLSNGTVMDMPLTALAKMELANHYRPDPPPPAMTPTSPSM